MLVDVITSEALFVCAVTLFMYTSLLAFPCGFKVNLISTLFFPFTGPFTAIAFTSSPICPAVTSFHIGLFPMFSSFAVIFFTASSVVVYIFNPVCPVSSIFSKTYIPLYLVPLPSPLYGNISNSWNSFTGSSVLFLYEILYSTFSPFSIIGFSVSLYNLWLAKLVIWIVSESVLVLIDDVPILSADTNTEALYCIPFEVSASILAWYVIFSISFPTVQPYIYHVNFCLPPDNVSTIGSLSLLLPGIYFSPTGNVSSNVIVILFIGIPIVSTVCSLGFIPNVTISSFLPIS